MRTTFAFMEDVLINARAILDCNYKGEYLIQHIEIVIRKFSKILTKQMLEYLYSHRPPASSIQRDASPLVENECNAL